MDPMTDREGPLRAFRAADEFAVEVFRTMRGLASAEGGVLAVEIRRATVRAAGALVASSWRDGASGSFEKARAGLLEARYYLSLARRLGFVDARRYRQLAVRQDAALRELEAVARRSRTGEGNGRSAQSVESAPDGW